MDRPLLTLVSLLTPMVLGTTWSEATGVGRGGDGVGVTVFIGTFGISGTKWNQNKLPPSSSDRFLNLTCWLYTLKLLGM